MDADIYENEPAKLATDIAVLHTEFVTCIEALYALCLDPHRPKGAILRKRLAFGNLRGSRRLAIDRGLALPTAGDHGELLRSRSVAAKLRMQKLGLPFVGRWSAARMESDPETCAVEFGPLLPVILEAAGAEYEAASAYLAEVITANSVKTRSC